MAASYIGQRKFCVSACVREHYNPRPHIGSTVVVTSMLEVTSLIIVVILVFQKVP